jgi:acyl-CoA thioesterase-2
MTEEQRRGRKIAMDKAELDAFLVGARTCRVATSSAQGPHLTPLWYVWDGAAVWLTSLVSSQRWTDLLRDPRVAILVDAGEDYTELRGAELRGTAEVIGEVPRTEAPDPRLDEPECLFACKYGDGQMRHDGRHAWLRVVPDKISSWDFRKLNTERKVGDPAEGSRTPPAGEAPSDRGVVAASPGLAGQQTDARPSILELLDLEHIEQDLFRCRTVFHDPYRLFGGQVAAQALYAAGLTVPAGRVPHSLHGYFLREGNALRPTVFMVERDRDGGSFSARRVVAVQDGAVIFNMAASFAAARPGPAADVDPEPRPELPAPERLAGWIPPRHPSFEFRSASQERPPTRFWVRCTADLPDDPLLHAAVLTYTTDMSSGLLALNTEGAWSGASLDHAVWFHRPVRTDDWIWHDLVPHTLASGRGLYTGAVYGADGSRTATIAQEALFRKHGPSSR